MKCRQLGILRIDVFSLKTIIIKESSIAPYRIWILDQYSLRGLEHRAKLEFGFSLLLECIEITLQ